MEAIIILFSTGIVSLFIAMTRKPILVLLTALIGVTVTAIVMSINWYTPMQWVKYDGIETDYFTIIYGATATLFSFLFILIGYSKFSKEVYHTGDYIAILIFSLCGALCLFSFTDLFMFFIGLEILSIPMYVMAGSNKKNLLSSEAAMKYFFTGSFATGVLLFGIACVYGALGTFQLKEMSEAIAAMKNSSALLQVGMILILAGFLFKVGAVPFHFWGPDVYSGSPNVVTGFMATVVKLAAFCGFLRLFQLGFNGLDGFFVEILIAVSVLTMFVGNLSALRQTKLKRLIAYSSITHVGYALICLLVKNEHTPAYLWTYFFAYGFSIVALITVSMIVNDENDDIDRYKAFARTNPFAGFVMILALLSLAGVPPLVGFFGKYLVFSSAIEQYPVLIIIALINSGIAIYYYLKVILTAISKDDNAEKSTVSPLHAIVLSISMFGLILGGFVTFWVN
ncbi:MAG: NADH-quinone oxidoreductase subunit N [Flavobacteriia bacterium]|nr:NADH-quinone oxidoreductase subunit N [Flavobacteriia bacterium]